MYNYFGNQIVRVNGDNGANAYQMAPNSSALLLDAEHPFVYLVQTDGAGYKTTTKYKIEPYVQEPEPDYKSIEERIKRLEDMISESNTITTKRNKTQSIIPND